MRILILLVGVLFSQGLWAQKLLIMGDSISAAYGIDKQQGWVALLEQKLPEICPQVQVINASVSGETSGGGRQRLPRLLAEHQPQWVVIELGGNDGLRGMPPMQMQHNLQQMVDDAEQAGAQPILLAIRIPTNYGERYREIFEQVFASLARRNKLPWHPFILEGIAEHPELMQDDGIHPLAEAQPILLDNVWPVLAPEISRACGRK